MAGRIPNSFVDELLARIDIVDVVDRRVPLKKAGKDYTACCPFHDEKTPSFSVSQTKQFYYCFGCGATGNAVGFLMNYERQEFVQAVETLAQQAGMTVPREEGGPSPQQVQRRKDIYTVLEQAAAFFARALKTHQASEPAREYLKRRGLTRQTIDTFQIGYAPPGWDNLLSALGKDEESRKLLVDAGMLIEKPDENKCYDRFRDRIMFPIADSRGRVIAFGGRVMGDEKPKYLNSPETEVFHKGRELYGLYQARQANSAPERLMVVEGYMDVVGLAQHDVPWSVATLGTATSTDHLRKLFRYVSEVVFCFDGDNAGRKAARRALENALPTLEDGRSAKFLFLPEGEDPDSLIQKIGRHGFEKLVSEAQSLDTWLFDMLLDGKDAHSLSEKARLSKMALPLLHQIPEGVYRQLMFKALAKRADLSDAELDHVVTAQPAQRSEAPAPVKREPVQIQKVRNDPLLFAIALLIQNPLALQHAELSSSLKDAVSSDEPSAQTLRDIIAVLEKNPATSTATLIGLWSGSEQGDVVAQALNLDFIPHDVELASQALIDVFRSLDSKRQKGSVTNVIENLKGKNFQSLSDDERQQLLRTMQQRKEFLSGG